MARRDCKSFPFKLRNAIWLSQLFFGQFAVCRLIWMSLYSALAAHIAKILNELPDVLIEAQLQDDEGLNTTSTTYKPYEDDDFSAYPIYYIIAVSMALFKVLTILASLSYGYIVRRQKTSNSGAYRFWELHLHFIFKTTFCWESIV